MRGLLREAIHYRKGLGKEEGPEAGVVADFERRYQEILNLAENEYMKITGHFPATVRDPESTILVMWKQLFQSLYPVVFPVKAASTADAARP